MARLLLIDNQVTQFVKFTNMLRSIKEGDTYHDVFPSKSDYKEIMGYVRISLNIRYLPHARKAAASLFQEYILGNKIELFIFDHKLIGHHLGENGIDLTMDLRKENDFKNIPVIFLSRTPRSHPDVKDPLDKLEKENCIWVEKGYAGQHILDQSYFHKFVTHKIPNLIAEGEFSALLPKAKSLEEPNGIYKNYLHIIREIIREGIEHHRFSARQKLLIEELYTNGTAMSAPKIKDCFKNYNNA